MPGHAVEAYYDTYWRPEERPLTGLYRQLEGLLATYTPPEGRYLDVGCGDGRTAGSYLRRAGRYTGVDVSASAVDRARSQGFDAVRIDDPADLPFEPGQFDMAVCLETLEHLVDPLAAVREMGRLLQPGGLLVATVPNVVYWRRRLDFALIGRWNPLGDRLSIEQPWRDPHLRFFTPSTLRRMVETGGFQIVEAGGHWGGLLVDVPGRQRFSRSRTADPDAVRRSSRLYEWLENRWPALLAFRLHVVARRA
jgi:SAM-dependent methyltransferase